MDTIKKKMMAMKNEKDSALDRAEQLEQSLRDTESAKSEVEEERDNLQKKIMQMESDLDQVQEGLQEATTSLEEAEKSKTQAYSSEEEEEMLIVVLDDDDDLVVGKSKPSVGNYNQHGKPRSPVVSYHNNNGRHSPAHYNNNGRNSPAHHRQSPSKSSKRRDYSNKSKNQNYSSRDQRQTNQRSQQRPQINMQKLSQRLNNIKLEQGRQSPPRRDRSSAERSPSLSGSMHSSYSDSGFMEKPHAVIAKPVERRRKKRRPRPEPEGASDPLEMDELDKLINNDEPIFSDYGTDDESSSVQNASQRRPGFSIAAFAIGLGLNSNTMIKYTIISTELQNIIRVSLKMYEEEIQGLNRRLQLCEEKLESTEERLAAATSKLEEASQAADESERGRKVLQDLNNQNEERISVLEDMLKESQEGANESERKFDETCRKLVISEAEATRGEERADTAEHKVKELEEELHVVTNSLRSLEISENKVFDYSKIRDLEEELKIVGNGLKSLEASEATASQREEAYEETIRDLNERLKDAENRASEFERQTNKMQKENESLEDELLQAKEKYKVLSDELETTLTDISGM